MRTSSMAFVGLLAYAAVALGSVPRSAHADALALAGGMQNGSGPVCYRWSGAGAPNGSIGATKNTDGSCSSSKYVMPVPLTNANIFPTTPRTYTVRGRRPTSSSTLSCMLSVYDWNGVLVSSATNSFAVTGAGYGTISLTVNNLVFTSSTFLTCTTTGPSTYLLKIDYAS